jgi:hypothetical protein
MAFEQQTAQQLDAVAKASRPGAELAHEALEQFKDYVSQVLGRRPSEPNLEDMVGCYFLMQRQACGLTEEQARGEVATAFEAARLKHRDFDQYRTAMAAVAGWVIPDMRIVVGALSLEHYIELLYATAKHADFLGFRDGKVQ